MTGRNSTAAARPTASDSLDINVILLQETQHVLLSTSLSSLPTTDSVYSFVEVPRFPNGRCMPLFVNVTKGTTLPRPGSSALSKTSRASITVPTLPRVRAMLREPVCVGRWVESVPTSVLGKVDEDAPLDDAPFPIPWTPEGSILSSETFKVILQQRRQGYSGSPNTLCNVSEGPQPTDCSDVSCLDDSGLDLSSPEVTASSDVMMPTIMLSNSTAALPLSLESSHSIAGIARRRGLQGPPPLLLSARSLSTSQGLYPGIPTPFLGSPTSYSPHFEFNSNSEFAKDLDLPTMCGDLRSRCPPMRLDTPVEEAYPGVPPSPPVACSDSSGSDEWAFTNDLVTDFDGELSATDVPITPSKPDCLPMHPSPCGTNSDESYSWSSAPTLVDSPQSVETQSIPDPLLATLDLPKQQRRRTVIIEAPRNSAAENVRPLRATVDLSHLADGTEGSTNPLAEIPFEAETPTSKTLSASFAESTPFSHRSSASMKPPIRGILKSTHKKRVRFSQLPESNSLEDGSEESRLASVFEGDEADNFTVVAPGRKRAATAPNTGLQAPRRHRSQDVQGAVRASFPRHPAVKSYVHAKAPVDTTPTPCSRATAHQSLQLVPRNVDKSTVGRPVRLTANAARVSMPVKSDAKLPRSPSPLPTRGGKKSMLKTPTDENAGRRASEGGKPSSISKSRMPFRSILTRFRA